MLPCPSSAPDECRSGNRFTLTSTRVHLQATLWADASPVETALAHYPTDRQNVS